jgi:Toprim domain-containing protein
MAKHNPCLSAADSARLDSWMVEIASEERGTITVAGDDYRVGDNRALVIHRTATFHDFITGTHGRGGLKLLQHVRKLDPEKALCAAREWLADKGTFGRLIPSSDGEDAAQAGDDAQRQAFIDTFWAAATPAASSTTAKAYLASRGLTVSAADMAQLRWVEKARGSDGALVVPSTDNNGGLVAIQETFISPDGSKSVSGCAGMAARITHRGPHDWSRKGLVRFGDDENPRLYLTEGTEDALSVRMAVPEPVVVTLGVAAIGKAKLPLGVKEIVVVRDGDMAGSPSDERLWRGVARLMGQGVDVLITQRPTRVFGKQSILKDANDVLQAHGAAGVQLLIDTASDKPDEIDSGVFLDELSRLSNTEYEVARGQAAKKAGMRFGTLDVERSERRKLRAAEGADDTVGPDDLPWPDPITHIGEVLDAAVMEIGKYLIAEPTLYDAMALWGCSAHLLSREDLDIHIAPRFAFQAPGKDCGKTTALNLLWGLSPRAELYSSASTASIFRMIHETHPTLLLDEADNQLNKRDGGADLKAILNSGHYRPTAYVARMEADADGGWHRGSLQHVYRDRLRGNWNSPGHPAEPVHCRLSPARQTLGETGAPAAWSHRPVD